MSWLRKVNTSVFEFGEGKCPTLWTRSIVQSPTKTPRLLTLNIVEVAVTG
jgi:hypothetical protein